MSIGIPDSENTQVLQKDVQYNICTTRKDHQSRILFVKLVTKAQMMVESTFYTTVSCFHAL